MSAEDQKLTSLERGEKDKEKRYPVFDAENRRKLRGTLVPFIFSPFGATGNQADKFLEDKKEDFGFMGKHKIRLIKMRISAKFVTVMARRLRRGAGTILDRGDFTRVTTPSDPVLKRVQSNIDADVEAGAAEDLCLKRNFSMIDTAAPSRRSKKNKWFSEDSADLPSPRTPRDVPGQFFVGSRSQGYVPDSPVM